MRPLDAMKDVILPPKWERRDTWELVRRRNNGDIVARVYLNGWGEDDELRFIIHYPGSHLPCPECNGTGRVKRAPIEQITGFLSALGPATPEEPDSEGKLRCLGCNDGRVNPVYGASNSFIRVPGLEPLMKYGGRFYGRLGARGLSSPSADDVQLIVNWCEDMVIRIYQAGEIP